MTLASVSLKKVNKTYPGGTPTSKSWWQFWKAGSLPFPVHVVKDADLEVRDGEFLVLVGPSGCGKSTTLRLVAGLEEASSGEISIGQRVVNQVAPRDRDVAMVFQGYALYPHMSVFDNMAFGLRLRRGAETEIQASVRSVAERLGLAALLGRRPHELSGGQRQRVAMGRAMVRRPQVFLMDEPLSNLDARLRVQMRSELQKLHRQLGVTTLFVTHDQTEAMTLGDRIALMRDGVIQQVDTPLNLYEKPTNCYVAGFVGSPGMNFIPARLCPSDEGPRVVADGLQFVLPPLRRAALAQHMGRDILVGIRPQDFRERTEGITLAGAVEVVEPLGAEKFVHFSVGPQTLSARVDARTEVRVGDTIRLACPCDRLHFFDGESELALSHSLGTDQEGTSAA